MSGTLVAQEGVRTKDDAKAKKEAKQEGPPNPFPNATTKAPELEGGVAWLNTAGPIQLSKLRGKIVLLDFWTYCCINCMHILPDLAKLEEEFPNELVVIGVHSAKFEGERVTENIRDAVIRYNIKHPVVNDAEMEIWRSFGVRAWPTRVIIDPEGNYVGYLSGEGRLDIFRDVLTKLIEYHDAKKTLDRTPLHFELEAYGTENTPLRYPGKVAVDPASNRLFVSDSSHNRVVIAELGSGKVVSVIGDGVAALRDGGFDVARFNDPQGLALDGNILYVADTKSHSIRKLDLGKRTVETVAGTGKQGFERSGAGPGKEIPLASPWDLLRIDRRLIVAMAGVHQIWELNLDSGIVSHLAGSGREDITDGTSASSAFAQPSGLATDGEWIYVADSEVSAIRKIRIKDNRVETVVGQGLFDFGDVDGKGTKVRLQHALGVCVHDGKLYVADTYNNKIRVIDPKTTETTSFVGDKKAGDSDEPPRFDEPAGIAVAAGKLYVADTNNHKIRVIDVTSKKVTTLELAGLEPPKPQGQDQQAAGLATQKTNAVVVKSGDRIKFAGAIPVPANHKLNPKAPMSYRVERIGDDGKANRLTSGKVQPIQPEFIVEVADLKLTDKVTLRFSVTSYPCETGAEGVCRTQTHAWDIPVSVDVQAGVETIQLPAVK